MLKAVSRENCPAAIWNKTADEITSAWAWHRWELLDARHTWYATRDKSFAIYDDHDCSKLLAIVPLFLVHQRPTAKLIAPYLESTGGPAIRSNLARRSCDKVRAAVIAEIECVAIECNARRLDLSCPPLAPELLDISAPFPNPLCKFGCSDTSTQTWVLNISDRSEDELWRAAEHRCRKQINKAKRNNLKAQLITPDKSMLSKYYILHKQTCLRNGIRPHPIGYFEAIFSRVAREGLCKSCIITSGDEVLAIHNFLIYKNSALYWTTAGNNNALKLCANDFGIWHAIKELKKSSIKYLECGEAFPAAQTGKLKGLNDFKKSFGGELYPYFRGQIVYRPITESLINIVRHIAKDRATR